MKFIKGGLTLLLILGFISTIPIAYQNYNKTQKVKNELEEIFNMFNTICDSDCT